MCAEKSKKLLRELKTSMWLPPYNQKLIEDIEAEVEDLSRQMAEETGDLGRLTEEEGIAYEEEREAKAFVLRVKHEIVNRHKRCVLTYLHHRTEKLEEYRWQTGPQLPKHYQGQLSLGETQYFNTYSRLLNKYHRLSGVDVTRDLEPPKDVQVEVSVNEALGEVELPDSGTVELRKNTRLLLRRTEAEQLIRQGVLQQIV